MKEELQRTALIFGPEKIRTMSEKRVIVFGLGGVGGYAAEALARSGIGSLDLVDYDTVSLSNINRQILALHSTAGMYKTDVAKNRILDINPDCAVTVHRLMFLPDSCPEIDFSLYDYALDCIDNVSGKIEIIRRSKQAGIPVISCMGTGNKKDPSLFRISDIEKTSVCPLARVMRRELKSRGITNVKAVWSPETPATSELGRVPGSTAFCPPAAGLLMASAVISDLMGE